jgi:hypothetical protein
MTNCERRGLVVIFAVIFGERPQPAAIEPGFRAFAVQFLERSADVPSLESGLLGVT